VDIANAAYEGRVDANLEFAHTFPVESPTFPYGVHVSVVEVDPETGFVKPILHRVMDDVGNVINPMLAEGQVHGGVVQGLGQVLLEEARYNEEGYLTNPNLSEYYVPTTLEIPRIEWRPSDRPHTSGFPTGSKGIGEAGAIAAPPAIIRAIEVALRPRRVRFRRMPVRPDDVLNALA
jgi:carbon-monoxide dehydrogenase large subunit